MGNYIFWTFMLAVVAVLSTYDGLGAIFQATIGASPGNREHARLDGRRKVILIRRDDVEHLLMTGGPVDVVVEKGHQCRAQIR
jgi:flagellar protein FliO/FliZ